MIVAGIVTLKMAVVKRIYETDLVVNNPFSRPPTRAWR
jgi:hypothetical protein